MDNNVAIKVNTVTKKYKIYQDKPVSLKERFLYISKGVFQEKEVLKDISITVEHGKMVGLVGRNGAGKSTLLKIMSRILQPDTGSVEINGRVSSLLELGAGFHMDFTGRENIYMNASIFGLNRKEINQRLDEIITFSELSTYIDNPVRTYSSGMFMRLAFSIAIHVNPDILLIDEILAVGDNAFQKKCIKRIEELKRDGKTIVFVSHDNGVMERLCDELYWIQDSIIKKHGPPDEIIRDYLDFLAESEEKRKQLEVQLQEDKEQEIIQQSKGSDVELVEQSEDIQKRWGNGAVSITKVSLVDEDGQAKFTFRKGQTIDIVMNYKLNVDHIDKPVFGVGIFRNDGLSCYGTNTHIDRLKFSISKKGTIIFKISALNLIQGDYYIDVACHHEDGTPYDYYKNIVSFSIHSQESDQGVVYLPHSWIFKGEEK